MTVRKRYRCRSCGKRFEVDVLTADEMREAERQRRPTSPISCPECKRTDCRDGWE